MRTDYQNKIHAVTEDDLNDQVGFISFQFGMFETMISGFQDLFPEQMGTSTKKTLFTGLMCVVQFGLGIPLVMQVA